MITSLTGSSVNKLFYKLLDELPKWPEEIRRDSKNTVDSPGPVVVELTNPRHRVLTVPRRLNNIFAVAAETLWVLAGRHDLAFLSYYLPRAKDYSDDGGQTWRGAYGPRLRGNRCGYDHTWQNDQLFRIVEELVAHTKSRRAVMGLLDPFSISSDANDHSNFTAKDFPCTQSISFMPREGRLDLCVFIRSNDILFGWSGINLFEFAFLHQLVASLAGFVLGKFCLVSNSLHYYTAFRMRFDKMINGARYDAYDHVPARSVASDVSLYGAGAIGLRTVDSEIEMAFGIEHAWRVRHFDGLDEDDLTFMNLPLFINDLVYTMLLGSLVLNRDKHPWSNYEDSLASNVFNNIEDWTLRVSVVEFLWRYYKCSEGGIVPPGLNSVLLSLYETCDLDTRLFISGNMS